MKPIPGDSRTWVALGITLLLWGTAPPAVRASMQVYSPGHVAVIRLIVASLTLAAYTLITRMPLPARRDWPVIAVLGFLGVTAYHVGFSFGLSTVHAGPASMLINTTPGFTSVLASLL